MHDNVIPQPGTLRQEGLVELFPGEHRNGAKQCRLHLGNWWLDAWSWLDLDPKVNHLYRGQLTFLDVGFSPQDTLLLGFEHDPDVPLGRLLTNDLCPISNVVSATTLLIDGMTIAPLRRFVTDTLMRRDIFRVYWTCPASRHDHHAYPGGLAQHNLEIATMAAALAPLDTERRELGIVLALLHDYGKMWCYRDDIENIAGREHEAYGLDQLRPGLDCLRREEPRLAAVMEELLGGRRAIRDRPYPLALRAIIRAFDQLSCEKHRTPRLCQVIPIGSRSWTGEEHGSPT